MKWSSTQLEKPPSCQSSCSRTKLRHYIELKDCCSVQLGVFFWCLRCGSLQQLVELENVAFWTIQHRNSVCSCMSKDCSNCVWCSGVASTGAPGAGAPMKFSWAHIILARILLTHSTSDFSFACVLVLSINTHHQVKGCKRTHAAAYSVTCIQSLLLIQYMQPSLICWMSYDGANFVTAVKQTTSFLFVSHDTEPSTSATITTDYWYDFLC